VVAVGEATRELGGVTEDRDVPDKPVWADAAEDAIETAGLDTKRLSSVRRLWHSWTFWLYWTFCKNVSTGYCQGGDSSN